MFEESISVGDVVQISPAHDAKFAGCMMIVTDVRDWGAEGTGLKGYVVMPASPVSRAAYYRVNVNDVTRVGRSEWRDMEENRDE